MTLGVYAMRDLKTEFISPVCSANDEVARRNFESAISQSQDVLFTHREDFQLFKIGSFNTESGVLTPEKLPILIADGKDVVV